MVPGPRGSLTLVECTAGRTVTPAMAAPMRRLRDAAAKARGTLTAVHMRLVHQSTNAPYQTMAVAPGVRAQPWREFVAELSVRR